MPLRAALRPQPLNQIPGEVGVTEVGDKVDRDSFPGAGAGAPDHIVVATILHDRGVVRAGDIFIA
jgi:hypothetical protein